MALGLLSASLSSADEALRVVVLRGEQESTTTSRRLEAELRSLGLVVISRAFSGAGHTHALLEQAARREGAIAAVRVIAQGTKAELWIADRVTNKTVLREISIESQDRNRADDSIAVGVAELLRASLMEVNAPSRRRGAYASPALRELGYAAPTRSFADDDARLWLNLGVGAELGIRGVGPSMLAQARASWMPDTGFGLELLGGMTLIPALIERSTGRARVSSEWLGAAATFSWSDPNSNWSARTGVGVLGVRVRARGESAARPLTAVTETTTSAGPYVYGGPVFGSDSFRIRLNAGALVLLTPPAVRFAEEAVARWGAPSLFVDLGVEGVISR